MIASGIVVLATHWPFTGDAVTNALEEATGRPVRIDSFSRSYFPPGCTAEGIRFLRHKHPEAAPIITVQKLVIQGSFTGLFSTPKRLNLVRVVGMHMTIPPKAPDDGKNTVALNGGPGGRSLAISKIIADGTVLEFIRENRDLKPYVLKIDRLSITEVGSGAPMFYRATLTNTEPPGIIRSEGNFGPWDPAGVGATQLSGSYTYDDIDLSHFKSIFGTGHARGQFAGHLSEIQTHGTVDVAAFRVEGSNHTVSLATTFEATVNGTNGLHALLSDCQIGVIRAEETQGPSIASPNRMRFRSRKGKLPKGVIAGAIGGLAASWIMTQFQSLLSRALEGDPDPHKGEGEDATVKTAKRISSQVFDHELSAEEKKTAGPLVHYAYGTGIGAVYGALSQEYETTKSGFGSAYGAAAWMLGDEIAVPALRLAKKPTETPISKQFQMLAGHIVYGIALEGVRRLTLKVL